ncbi:MAG: OmpH family outer membrane protein, partial [Proteobacteria bacterium]|nr:OmpH family outer membrane protein [Pseudomonadota bacterium]
MTSKVLTLGVGALVAFASISAAQAQTAAPAAPAAPAVTHGAPIAGMCTISVDQAIGASVVGKFVGTRMDQIVAQVRAELQPEE